VKYVVASVLTFDEQAASTGEPLYLETCVKNCTPPPMSMPMRPIGAKTDRIAMSGLQAIPTWSFTTLTVPGLAR